jgi:hypothetical protein
MTDWATEEAARLSNLDRDTREESQWVCDQIASALRSAFQRGKVEASREAYRALEAALDEPSDDWGGVVSAIYELEARATALEQENKD